MRLARRGAVVLKRRVYGTVKSPRIKLVDDQRELIVKSVRLGCEVDVADLEVGWATPSCGSSPARCCSETDELNRHYHIADDQRAVVDH